MAKNQAKIPQSDLPRITLEETVEVAEKLHENLAGDTIDFDGVARLLGTSPNTAKTKYKIWGADAYGIIKKDSNKKYSLSENGRKIVAPTYPEERIEAIRKAILTPVILSKFYTDYNNHLIPQPDFFDNLLETKYSIPRDRIDEAKSVILSNAIFAEIIFEDEEGKKTLNLEVTHIQQNNEDSVIETPGDVFPEKETVKLTLTDIKTESDSCFYISPIGEDDSEFRKHSDMLLKHLIEPVAKDFGMNVIRADKIEKTGLITQQILEYLVKTKLCIADLSFKNPNVFYELGVRHTCKLPTIQVIRKQDKIPFDVSQGRTITIDTSDVYTLIDRIESAKRELHEYIEEILNNPSEYKESNPISVYLPNLKITNK